MVPCTCVARIHVDVDVQVHIWETVERPAIFCEKLYITITGTSIIHCLQWFVISRSLSSRVRVRESFNYIIDTNCHRGFVLLAAFSQWKEGWVLNIRYFVVSGRPNRVLWHASHIHNSLPPVCLWDSADGQTEIRLGRTGRRRCRA